MVFIDWTRGELVAALQREAGPDTATNDMTIGFDDSRDVEGSDNPSKAVGLNEDDEGQTAARGGV